MLVDLIMQESPTASNGKSQREDGQMHREGCRGSKNCFRPYTIFAEELHVTTSDETGK